jgi:hypothetical protein
MAYFAELDTNNIVLRVIAIADADLLDENGNEIEALGIARCKQLFGENTIWLQTSYNTLANVHANGKTPFRKNFAGIGFAYDAQRDAFIEPKPEGEGWLLDETTCIWRNAALEAKEAARKAAQQEIGVTRV